MMKKAAFLLALAALPSALTASPVQYTISFTLVSGVAPTSGSFTYDPSTEMFTQFDVVWDGLVFDMTADANNPTVDTSNPSCPGGPGFGFALMAKQLNSCAETYAYSAQLMNHDANFHFGMYPVGAYYPDIISISVAAPSSDGAVYGYGNWTITPTQAPVPEPGTPGLFALGGTACILASRKRRRFRSKR